MRSATTGSVRCCMPCQVGHSPHRKTAAQLTTLSGVEPDNYRWKRQLDRLVVTLGPMLQQCR
jgi:hypothetical protein